MDSIIKKKRVEAGLTQNQLAKACGVSQSCVAHWENGLNYPRISTLHRLSKVLNCTVEQLLTEKSA